MIDDDTKVWCIGGNLDGQVDVDSTAAFVGPGAGPIRGLSGAVDLTMSANGACALRDDKSVACWGCLFEQPRETCNTHLEVVAHGVDQIESTATQLCKRVGGAVECAMLQGPLKSKTEGVFVRVPLPATAVQLAADYHSMCALLRSGEVHCWGPWKTSPRDTMMRAHIPPAESLASGNFHWCAVTSNQGGVWCWGRTGMTASEAPHGVSGTRGIRKLALGDKHGCGIDDAGRLLCWGENGADGYASLGKSHTEGKYGAEPVLDGARDVVIAGTLTCVMMTDDTLRCSKNMANTFTATHLRVDSYGMPADGTAVTR